MKELLSLGMENKEKVKYFNQRFASHLNNFSATINPVEETLIEYYTSALCPIIPMFFKRSVNPSLVETYEETNKVESKLDTINKHTTEPEVNTFSSKKHLLLTRPKEEHSSELENVVKMVQKLSNKIVDLEKDKEASSSKKQFKPYLKEREEGGTSQPPVYSSSVLNFNEVGMDHFCTFHQEPHFEKSCR